MAQSGAKKKVLLAITKSNWGGAQRYVFDLATHIPKEEFDVVVAHGGNGVMAKKLRESGIRTIEIPGLGRDINAFADLSSLKSLLRTIRLEKPDVLHLNSSKVGLLGALAGRITGTPRIIFTAHGWPFNEDRSLLERIFFRALALLTAALSHRTIAVSEAVASSLGRNIAVIRNGVEVDTYMNRAEARTSLVPQHAADDFWFGTIAELHPIKGLSYAIDAFQKHAALYPTARYIIIGDGEERERLEEQIQRLGFASRIHLAGFHEDASKYLKAFDVFVLPSLSEALSFSILEAGAAQVPVIATNVGGISEIIVHGETGILVQARDSRALAEEFDRIQSDSPRRESLASTLHTHVMREFSLERMVEKTFALYR